MLIIKIVDQKRYKEILTPYNNDAKQPRTKSYHK